MDLFCIILTVLGDLIRNDTNCAAATTHSCTVMCFVVSRLLMMTLSN